MYHDGNQFDEEAHMKFPKLEEPMKNDQLKQKLVEWKDNMDSLEKRRNHLSTKVGEGKTTTNQLGYL